MKINLASASLVIISLLTTGCGTIQTLTQTDTDIRLDLNSRKSNCFSLPRVYSGVAYNICKLNSPHNDIPKQFAVNLYLFDCIPSGVTDTFALPYTIYKQSTAGSIPIKYPYLTQINFN